MYALQEIESSGAYIPTLCTTTLYLARIMRSLRAASASPLAHFAGGCRTIFEVLAPTTMEVIY